MNFLQQTFKIKVRDAITTFSIFKAIIYLLKCNGLQFMSFLEVRVVNIFNICGESSGDVKTSRVRGTAFNLSQVPSVGFREYPHRHRRRNTHEVSTTMMTAHHDHHLMIITEISPTNTIIDQYHDQYFDFTKINITTHQG